MHPQEQIDFVRKQLKEKREPFVSAFNLLLHRADSSFAISHHAVEDFSVPGFYQDKDGHRRLSLGLQLDGMSAYSCALAWKLSGKKKYAERALYFLNSWAKVNKKYSKLDGSLVMSYSGTTFMIAADLLKDYKKWKAADREQFNGWVKSVFRHAANSIRFIMYSKKTGKPPARFVAGSGAWALRLQAPFSGMLWVSGWRDSLRNRPRQRTDSFEISPAPPSNVDQELSGAAPCGVTTADLKASQRGR